MPSSMYGKEIAKLFRDDEYYSLLHANVLLGTPLPVIKRILQLDDDDYVDVLREPEERFGRLAGRFGSHQLWYPWAMGVDLLFDALSYGGHGVFTFLVNEIKHTCNDFSNFVDMMKEGLTEFDLVPLNPLVVVDFVMAFPELMCTRSKHQGFTPLEFIFSRLNVISEDDDVNVTSLAQKIVKNPNNTFSLEPQNVLSPSSADALPIILTKVNEFYFYWIEEENHDGSSYQQDDDDIKHMETISKIIRQLFQQTTTVTKIDWIADHSPTLNRNPQFIQNSILSSLLSSEEEETTTTTTNCPIEQAKVMLNYAGGCALLPFLPYMNQLKKLIVELNEDSMSSITSNDWQVIVDLVAQQQQGRRRLRSLTFDMDSIRCNQPEPFLTILEAVRNSSTLEAFHMDIPSHEGEVSIKETAHKLQERMVDILQQNTTLKNVAIYTEQTWQSTLAQKIRYLCCLNRFGRGCIREETKINLRQFLHLLDGIVVVDDGGGGARVGDNDEDMENEEEEKLGIENIRYASYAYNNMDMEYRKVSANMKTSIIYGLLRERPAIWIQNQNHQSASSCTTTNPTTTTTTTGKRKRDDGD